MVDPQSIQYSAEALHGRHCYDNTMRCGAEPPIQQSALSELLHVLAEHILQCLATTATNMICMKRQAVQLAGKARFEISNTCSFRRTCCNWGIDSTI